MDNDVIDVADDGNAHDNVADDYDDDDDDDDDVVVGVPVMLSVVLVFVRRMRGVM